MTCNKKWYANFKETQNGASIYLGYDRTHQIKGYENIPVTLPNGIVRHIHNVVDVPGINKNLISVSTITNHNLKVEFLKNYCIVKDLLDQYRTVATRVRAGGLYKIDVTNKEHYALTFATMPTESLWHQSGVVIVESILHNQNNITDQSWGLLILLYVLLQVSRVIVVVVLYPGLRYFGYGVNWKEAIILIWSGLRGVVALALSLTLNHSSNSLGIPQLPPKTGALFVFFTGGVVFLTLILNGSTAQFLLHFLGMDKTSDFKMRIVHHIRSEMNIKALDAFPELREDEELGRDDWPSVEPYLTCLEKQEEGNRAHRHCISVNENEQHRKDKQDIRLLLLNGVQAAYWRMLCERKMTQPAAIFLMRSIDEAIDMVDSRERLLDWEVLEAHVRFSDHFKCFQMRCLPQKLATFFDVAKLRLACYICAAFLRAHKITRRLLSNFIGESNVVEYVIRESEEEGEPATQFLQEVQRKFPQVLRDIRTKSVAHSILLHLSEYVQNLKKSGLLEAKEMDRLHKDVEMDLKKLRQKESFVEKFLAFFCIWQLGVHYCPNNRSQLRESTGEIEQVE